MPSAHWNVDPEIIFGRSSIIPVLVVQDLEKILPLAENLQKEGIGIFEVTLRTPVALDAVSLLRKHFPEALVGVGTVLNEHHIHQSIEHGAQFAISPGLTHDLLRVGLNSSIPLIPGISTVSELMLGLEYGYSHFKFFPAEASGGVKVLEALYNPFPKVRFCPTGGINATNYKDYLQLPNVSCVGGSWIISKE